MNNQSYLLTRLREYPARNTSHKKKDLCFAISLHLNFLFFEEDGHEALEKLEGSTRTGGSPILRWSLNRVDEASLECHLSTKSGQTAVPGQPDGRHLIESRRAGLRLSAASAASAALEVASWARQRERSCLGRIE